MKTLGCGQDTALGRKTGEQQKGGKEGVFQKACPDWLPPSRSILRDLIPFLPHGHTHTRACMHALEGPRLQSPLEKPVA